MSSITSNIRLNCFLRGETVNKIFDVEILTIENFERLDQIIRQDLLQICFNLHKVNFLQPNFFIVSSVNSFTTRQGVFIDQQKEISNYFSTLRIDALIKKLPYHQENGERGPIHILIYPEVMLE